MSASASEGCAGLLCSLAASLKSSEDAAAIAVLHQAACMGGAEMAWFIWCAPAAEEQVLMRFLVAKNPAHRFASMDTLGDPASALLAHAARSTEPVLVQHSLLCREASSERHTVDSTDAVEELDSAWLLPAIGTHPSGSVGLLVLAARSAEELKPVAQSLPAYRALAMELGDWFHRQGRAELCRDAELTEQDLDLLRREAQGQSSKRIAQALETEAAVIDCRFHRLNARLGVNSRRESVRLCMRYGLL